DRDRAAAFIARNLDATIAADLTALAGAIAQAVAIAIAAGGEPRHDRRVGAAGDRIFRNAIGRAERAHGHRRSAGWLAPEYADANRLLHQAERGDSLHVRLRGADDGRVPEVAQDPVRT